MFKKKKKRKIPIHRAVELSKKGFSESDIINILREEGHGPLEVDKALRDSLKGAVKKPKFPKVDKLYQFGKIDAEEKRIKEKGKLLLKKRKPEFELGKDPLKEMEIPKKSRFEEPEKEVVERNIPKFPSIPGEEDYEELKIRHRTLIDEEVKPERITPPGADSKDIIEELVETVIEEKWNSVKDKLDSFERKSDRIKKDIDSMKDDIDDLKKSKSVKVDKLEDKIGIFEKTSSDMSEKMDSMEEVIKNSLAPMMESLRSLSDTIRELKKKEK